MGSCVPKEQRFCETRLLLFLKHQEYFGGHMVTIEQAIIHEVPRGKYVPGTEAQLRLSEAPTVLAAETRRFVQEDMLDFALRSPRYVVQDPNSSSTTPSLVSEILKDPGKTFVDNSKKLAANLYAAQTGASPSGILIVAIVKSGEGRSVAILKAEHQEGMQLKQIDEQGVSHFDLEHLNELIIGNNSRVYKIAVLHDTADGVAGEMVDQQNGVGFAAFFLSNFLGCELAENSEVQTKEFVDFAMNYANDVALDPVKQARYATAVVAYVQSPSETFEAAEFAEAFLDAEDRDDFLASMPGEMRSAVITKNTKLVPGHAGGLRFYGNGVVVSASAEALERGALEVLSDDEGGTVLRLKGALRRLGLVHAPKG